MEFELQVTVQEIKPVCFYALRIRHSDAGLSDNYEYFVPSAFCCLVIWKGDFLKKLSF